MKKLIITYDELGKCILENRRTLPERLQDVFASYFPEFRRGDFGSIQFYFTKCGPATRLRLSTDNFQFITEGVAIITPDNETIKPQTLFKHIMEYTSWVFRSYENKLFPGEENTWDLGYCQGDDDVDYQSSYLDIAINIINFYLVTNNVPVYWLSRSAAAAAASATRSSSIWPGAVLGLPPSSGSA